MQYHVACQTYTAIIKETSHLPVEKPMGPPVSNSAGGPGMKLQATILNTQSWLLLKR